MVEDHLLEGKVLAESIGEKLDLKHVAGLAGVLHDLCFMISENSLSNLESIFLQAVKNPDSPPKRGGVHHSTAGGRLLFDYFHKGKIDPYKGLLAEIVGNAIISYHSALQDYLNYETGL